MSLDMPFLNDRIKRVVHPQTDEEKIRREQAMSQISTSLIASLLYDGDDFDVEEVRELLLPVRTHWRCC